ncbi:MAG: hypothetical protein C0483_23315 [Pirellula sp.]|nr:hypothetical protein [Pirellula sp.]
MKFARWMFGLAGTYGLLLLVPYYFMEDLIGREYPPAITHPEFFYGFVGTAVAWQVAFLVIARDPARYRLLMPAAMLEKASFGFAALWLLQQGRIPGSVMAFAGIDLLLGVGFFAAFLSTGGLQAKP